MNTDCVILAAGLSTRMGRNKLTMDIHGRTVIESCVGAFYPLCRSVIVVTGEYHEEIRRCMAPYPRVRIVYNEDYPQGMFSSVKAGIQHVETERFFLSPGDYPFLQTQTLTRLIQTPGGVTVPVYKGEAGHPVLLDRLMIPAILRSTQISLRDCLKSMKAFRQEVAVEDMGVVTDLDTMAEFRAAAGRSIQ